MSEKYPFIRWRRSRKHSRYPFVWWCRRCGRYFEMRNIAVIVPKGVAHCLGCIEDLEVHILRDTGLGLGLVWPAFVLGQQYALTVAYPLGDRRK